MRCLTYQASRAAQTQFWAAFLPTWNYMCILLYSSGRNFVFFAAETSPMSDIQGELREFQEGPWSIVIFKNDRQIFRSNMGGLQPLLEALSQHRGELDRATIYDKVVGRAAAFIIASSGIRKVVTPIISASAPNILRQGGKQVRYSEKVDRILDADRRDLEAFERLSLDANSPEQFLKLLQR